MKTALCSDLGSPSGSSMISIDTKQPRTCMVTLRENWKVLTVYATPIENSEFMDGLFIVYTYLMTLTM